MGFDGYIQVEGDDGCTYIINRKTEVMRKVCPVDTMPQDVRRKLIAMEQDAAIIRRVLKE